MKFLSDTIFRDNILNDHILYIYICLYMFIYMYLYIFTNAIYKRLNFAIF